ncbi:MAG: ATP-binding cassette domain-containing protein [Alphaproteobacteria bacterium]|nr:ATP-binding cassette domain-containing protein [Alphaproteobacteria bacterium]
MTETPIIDVAGLTVRYGETTAVDGVDLTIARGEVFAIVGESGCGKSSLARALMRLAPAATGRIRFDGIDITAMPDRALRPMRRRLQMVFQDPFASLNPRKTVGQAIGDPLRYVAGLPRAAVDGRVRDLLAQVGLRPEHADRLPHEFSGGQRQRIGIARALAVDPDLLVCDEPVSALDVSVRAQILNLLADIRRARNLSMLFISHDLSVVEHIADRVAVMYLGRIVEIGPAGALFAAPRHPYTRALVAAVPRIRGGGAPRGEEAAAPAVAVPPRAESGCRFLDRCPRALPACARVEPVLEPVGDRALACANPWG